MEQAISSGRLLTSTNMNAACRASGLECADSSRIRPPMLNHSMLELRDLRLRRGAAVLFDRANLTIFRGDKIGIVGRNGCGKSSLLALAARRSRRGRRRLFGARQAQFRLGIAGAAAHGADGAGIRAQRRFAAHGNRGAAGKGARRGRRDEGSRVVRRLRPRRRLHLGRARGGAGRRPGVRARRTSNGPSNNSRAGCRCAPTWRAR